MTKTTLADIAKPVFSQQRDRCDRCGAAASVRAQKKDLELLFCGHHGAEHESALRADKWLVLK